jgi:hypothetical protein
MLRSTKVKISLFLLIGLIALCGCADDHVNKSAQNGHQNNQVKEMKKNIMKFRIKLFQKSLPMKPQKITDKHSLIQ